jgi:hypothetical protein
MHKIPTACPLQQQRELRCQKEFFLDEWRQEIASLRRNNGDAVSQHDERDEKPFAEWRAAMQCIAKESCASTMSKN